MNYILRPSLEHIAAVRIAITLWAQDDIRNSIAKFYPSFGEGEKEWQKIEDKVVEKLPKLLLPKYLKKKVSGFIKPIGLQILRWRKYQGKFIGANRFIKDNFSKFHWTPQGTIDQEKMAEMLVGYENFNAFGRYKLACIYCLEDHIYSLWKQLNEFQRKELSGMKMDQEPLISFWSHYVEGKIDELEGENKRYDENNTPYAFQSAAISGNKVGAKYFLQKLTPEERERVLVHTAGNVAEKFCCSTIEPRSYHADVSCFLLANMSEEQQMELFRHHLRWVLKCFLEWPWQDFFMKTVEHAWNFLTRDCYGSLLRSITSKTIKDYTDYDYKKLFKVFWLESSSVYKKHILFREGLGLISLLDLFEIEDKENIKLIFRDPYIAGKKELVSCGIAQDICGILISDERWDLLKFFIEECVPYKDIIIELKEEFKKPIRHGNEKRNKFCQLLDSVIEKNNKRRNTEENECPDKMLYSVEYKKVKEGERCQELELNQN